MATERNQEINPNIYIIALFFAVIIGIDCAIGAAYSMSLVGGFFAIPVIIAFCALAGFLLNTILYYNDLLKVMKELFNPKNWSFKDLKVVDVMKNIAKNIAALVCSTFFALFTYHAYTTMALVWLHPIVIGVFCAAYFIGSFALLRGSFELTYGEKKEPINEKIKSIRKSFGRIFVTTLLLAIVMTAVCYLSLSLVTGANAGLLVMGIHAPLIVVYSIASILLATELMFAVKTAIWVGDALPSEQPSLAWDQNLLYKVIGSALAGLNALGNAAITAASGSMISAPCGGILSFSVMTKALNDVESNTPRDKIVRAMFYILPVFIGLGMISKIGIMYAAILSLSLITLVCAADYCYGKGAAQTPGGSRNQGQPSETLAEYDLGSHHINALSKSNGEFPEPAIPSQGNRCTE